MRSVVSAAVMASALASAVMQQSGRLLSVRQAEDPFIGLAATLQRFGAFEEVQIDGGTPAEVKG